MKKTYKQPIMKAIDIDTTEMIAQSDAPDASTTTLDFGGSNLNGGPSAAETKATRNIWDEKW